MAWNANFLIYDDKDSVERRKIDEKVKVIEINNLYIYTIQKTYHSGKPTDYGIQVWNTKERLDPSQCFINKWYTNKDEANRAYFYYKSLCSID